MKKLALLLALLLCLAPVLSACGANSSAKKAAVAAVKAEYINCDADDYFDVALRYNVDLIDEYIKDTEQATALKESARAAKDTKKESIKAQWDFFTKSEDEGGLGAEDEPDVDYEVIYVETYGEKTDAFDKIMEGFRYKGTDLEDEVTKVAKVGILVTVEYTVDDDDYVDAEVETLTCYCIDGDWYIG